MAQTGLEIAALTPAPSVLGLQDAPPAGFSTCLHTVKQTTSSLPLPLGPLEPTDGPGRNFKPGPRAWAAAKSTFIHSNRTSPWQQHSNSLRASPLSSTFLAMSLQTEHRTQDTPQGQVSHTEPGGLGRKGEGDSRYWNT